MSNKKSAIPKKFACHFSSYNDWVRFQCKVSGMIEMSSAEFKKFCQFATDDEIADLISKVNRRRIKLIDCAFPSDIIGAVSKFMDVMEQRMKHREESADLKETTNFDMSFEATTTDPAAWDAVSSQPVGEVLVLKEGKSINPRKHDERLDSLLKYRGILPKEDANEQTTEKET